MDLAAIFSLFFDNYKLFADVRFELRLESFDSSGKLF